MRKGLFALVLAVPFCLAASVQVQAEQSFAVKLDTLQVQGETSDYEMSRCLLADSYDASCVDMVRQYWNTRLEQATQQAKSICISYFAHDPDKLQRCRIAYNAQEESWNTYIKSVDTFKSGFLQDKVESKENYKAQAIELDMLKARVLLMERWCKNVMRYQSQQ